MAIFSVLLQQKITRVQFLNLRFGESTMA